MHIPDSMITGAVCPVTAVSAVSAVSLAFYNARKAKVKPDVVKFALVCAFVFAMQMLNFPVENGTSGHFLGAALAAAVLGVPFGILAMSLVVAVQCAVFSDGGFLVLGANVFNMAVVGVLCGSLFKFYKNEKFKYAALGLSAWFSVLVASFFCSLEVFSSVGASFMATVSAMIMVHAKIGVGEALITMTGFYFAQEPMKAKVFTKKQILLVGSVIAAAIVSPFASSFPDGLERVAENLFAIHESAPAFTGLLSDYALPMINNEYFSVVIAAFAGVVFTFFAAKTIGKILQAE